MDLSESLWTFAGPSGRSAEFGPEAFRACLRRWRPAGERSGPPEPDLVLGDVSFDFKALSARKTLLFVTYHYADPFARPSDEPAAEAETWGKARPYVNLHLHALVEELLAASPYDLGATLHDRLSRNYLAAGDPPAGSAERLAEGDITDEDRAWLEADLSRLGEYGSYELTEEQLAEEKPIRYVPGLGLVVEEDDGSAG